MSSTKRPPKTRKPPVPTQGAEAKVKPAHRPTACTKEMADQFARYISGCPFFEPAAHMCGITEQAARTWWDRGQAAQEAIMGGMKIDPIEAPYHYFFVTVARARASWETSLAATVTHHARPNDTIINSKTGKPYDHQGDPHVALAALKCAHPDRWGQRKLEVVSKATVTHHANLSSLSEEELEALDRVHAKLTPDLYGEDEE